MSQGAALLDLWDSAEGAGFHERIQIHNHAREIATSVGSRSAQALEELSQTELAWFDLRNKRSMAELSAVTDGKGYPPPACTSLRWAHRRAAEAYGRGMDEIKLNHLPAARKALVETVDSECAEVTL